MHIEEEKSLKELQANLNSIRCYTTKDEGKEHLLEQMKKYYKNNKEVILETQKKYRKEHKEVILEKAKEKITCACGKTFMKTNKVRHEKTKKHCDYILNN